MKNNRTFSRTVKKKSVRSIRALQNRAKQPFFDQWFILLGASALTGVAGYVNAVMLNYYSVPLSHMTGATTRLGMDIGHGNFTDFYFIGSIVLGFLIGSMISALIIGQTNIVRPGPKYSITLVIEGLLLSLVTWLALNNYSISIPLAATACGLQNGMASSYRGLVIRTTHVTGTVTDVGVLLGQKLRGKKISNWKLVFLSTLVFAFLFGGIIGTYLYLQMHIMALIIPAIGILMAGVLHALFTVISPKLEDPSEKITITATSSE